MDGHRLGDGAGVLVLVILGDGDPVLAGHHEVGGAVLRKVGQVGLQPIQAALRQARGVKDGIDGLHAGLGGDRQGGGVLDRGREGLEAVGLTLAALVEDKDLDGVDLVVLQDGVVGLRAGDADIDEDGPGGTLGEEAALMGGGSALLTGGKGEEGCCQGSRQEENGSFHC